MKMVINYDLLEKIKEAKQGFSLVKNTKQSLKVNAVFYGVCTLFVPSITDTIQFANYMERLPLILSLNIGLITLMEAFFDYSFGQHGARALKELNKLSRKLKALNINTTGELLLETSRYHTEYELKTGDKVLPYVVQKKFFNIPTSDEKKETSICQEHVIGSRIYILSKGRFVKQSTLVFAANNV